MSFTADEKVHWKRRISTRIERAIEEIYRREGANVRKLIQQEATEQVLDKLQIRKDYDRRQQLDTQIANLNAQRKEVDDKITQHLTDLGYTFGYSADYQHSGALIARQARLAETDVLLTREFGQSIVRLKKEQEQLLDTVWLVTSPIQMKQLWQKLLKLLGDQPTALQEHAMTPESIE